MIGSFSKIFTSVGRSDVSQCRRRRNRTRIRSKLNDDQLDVIESMIGKLFGKKALEDRSPMGMNRLDVPEMYPATTDEWALPIESDTPEMAMLRPLLAKTQLEKAPLRLAYDASNHGWSAESFHSQVNTFGAGLIVAETQGGAYFGGYNPRGWIGLGEDRDAIAAFLFTWPINGKKAAQAQERPIKLQKVGGASMAVIDSPQLGVQFGPDGLKLLQPGKERMAKCRLGSYYSRLPDGSRSLFAPGESEKGAELVSLKCFVAQGEGESWTLDGIVWKTG